MFKRSGGRRGVVVALGVVVGVAAGLVMWLSGRGDHRQASKKGWALSTAVGRDGARLSHGDWSVIVRPGATGQLIMRPAGPRWSEQQALARLAGDVGGVRAGGGVRVALMGGRLGKGGAALIRRLSTPLPTRTRGTFAYFDPSLGLWRPIPTRISADRRTLTGVVHHFTALDTIYYGVSWVLGQRASKPECSSRLPTWVQPQGIEFFADKNAPLLWCAETDPSDGSRLQIKVAVNRGYGVAVQAAVRPAVSRPPFGNTPADVANRSYARLLHWSETSVPLMGTQEASFSFTEAQVRSVGDAPLIRVVLDQRDLFASLVFGALTGVAEEGAYGNFAAYAAAYAAILQCETEISAPVAHGHWSHLIPGFIRCLRSERTTVAKLAARAVAARYPHEGPQRSIAAARKAVRLFKWIEFTAIAANVSAWLADRASPANILELRALVRPLGSSQAPAGQPVLGIKEVYPGGKGWGTKAPAIVYNGGVPSGLIDHIRWRNWGAPVAYGTGITSIYKPHGGYYSQQVPADLRAQDLGKCRPGGPLTYRRLYVRNPLKPGGPLDDWRLWALLKTLCRKAF